MRGTAAGPPGTVNHKASGYLFFHGAKPRQNAAKGPGVASKWLAVLHIESEDVPHNRLDDGLERGGTGDGVAGQYALMFCGGEGLQNIARHPGVGQCDEAPHI